MTPELSADEQRALIDLLRGAIREDRFPLSPRVVMLKAILAKLDPASMPEARPLPPVKQYAPPRVRRRR